MENEGLRQLCEQAGREQDSTRLMELVQEIIETIDTTRQPKPVELPKKGEHGVALLKHHRPPGRP